MNSLSRIAKYWLRWLVVLPAALLAGFLIGFPLHWILYANLTGSGFVVPYPELPERLLSPLVGAIAFVWAGAKVAPSQRLRVAATLMALWISVSAVGVLTVLGEIKIAGQALYFHGYGLAPILGVVGAIVGFRTFRNDYLSMEATADQAISGVRSQTWT